MKCKKCGCDVFSVRLSFITEYHDATVEIGAIMAKSVLETSRTLTGSFYLDIESVVATCYSCGWKTKEISKKHLDQLANVW